MALGELETLLDNLRIRLPGALDGTLLIELHNTMNEMCQVGHVWRQLVEVPLTAGERLYTVTPPTGALPLAIYGVSHVSNRISSNIAWDPSLNQAYLAEAPDAAEAVIPLYLDFAFTPDEDFEDVPLEVRKRYHHNILDGALARMMSQIAKPYSNPGTAAIHAQRFRSFLGHSRRDSRTGGKPNAQNWSFPSFA